MIKAYDVVGIDADCIVNDMKTLIPIDTSNCKRWIMGGGKVKRIICYSGGHSSALVAIEVSRKYPDDQIILLNHDINPNVELEDVKRFKREVAE